MLSPGRWRGFTPARWVTASCTTLYYTVLHCTVVCTALYLGVAVPVLSLHPASLAEVSQAQVGDRGCVLPTHSGVIDY